MTDYEHRVWQAVGCARTLIKLGRCAPGLAIHRGATKYNVDQGHVASRLGQRASRVKQARRQAW
jgi:hypothetical protein